MKVEVNGEPREVAAGATVADVAGPSRRGVAVALDGEVVPGSEWETTELTDGQRVEVLHAVQGG